MLEALLYDLETNETIADLTEFSTIKVSPRLSRSLAVTCTLPGDTAAIRGVYDDGYPIQLCGRRGIKVNRDADLIANTILWNLAPSGDENQTEIVLTGYDPIAQFVKRFVRDTTGNLADPTFASPSSGAAILLEALQGTMDPVLGVGPLPIDIDSGQFDTTIPPAVDLSAQLTDWPMRLSDLFVLIVNSGVVDVVLDPVDDSPNALGVLNAVNRYGADRSGSVHFDYATGDFSVSHVRRMQDLDELCNRLYYYLGPKLDPEHWRGNITATEAGLEDFYDLQIASRDKFVWVYEDVRIFDDLGVENDARPMFHELWKTEVTLRVEPRQLLFLTPARGAGCPFQPYDDYFLGDVVSANVADIVGPEFAGGTFRIYGFDLEQGPNGPEQVSEFIVSPDGL